MSNKNNSVNPSDMDAVWEDFDRVRHNREMAYRSTLGTRRGYIEKGIIVPNSFRPTPLVKSRSTGKWFIPE